MRTLTSFFILILAFSLVMIPTFSCSEANVLDPYHPVSNEEIEKSLTVSIDPDLSDALFHYQTCYFPRFPGLFSEDRTNDPLRKYWEWIDGGLYDTRFHALLCISEDAVFNSAFRVAAGTRYIRGGALGCNDTLKEIILPEGVEAIGKNALTGISYADKFGAIEKVFVPSSVRIIMEPLGWSEYGPMGCCKPLFCVNKNNPRYRTTEDGLLIDLFESTILWCASFPEPRVVKVPEGIKRIASNAFSGCHEIISIELPDTITEIGRNAISNMENLMQLTIPQYTASIGPENFCLVGMWSSTTAYRGFYLDAEGHMQLGEPEDEDGLLDAEQVLSHFGIDEKPGIIFESDACVFEINEGSMQPDCFDSCDLPVYCHEDAKYVESLREMDEYLITLSR